MLALIIAAALAAEAAPSPSPAPSAQAASTQAAAPSKPKSRLDEVICKTAQVPGIGTTRESCATRREWNDREALIHQELRAQQTGFCGGKVTC